MFEVTAAAAKQIRIAAEQGGIQGMALRVVAKVNRDGSFEYNMGFDETTEADIQVNSEGVDIIIDPAYVELLDQTTLDYVELDNGEFHFVFMNLLDPNYVPPKDH